MKGSFYPRLAWSGIRKNRKLYLPYIFSCIGMVMMYYILHSLSYAPALSITKGGTNIQQILSLGKFVIAVFALLFLFYTNSFLVRRRYKEFGLYNILGMDKRKISRIVLWESLTVAVIALTVGIAAGIALSKLAELGLVNAVHGEVDYRFTLNGDSIAWTAGIFAVIFVLLALRSLWQIRRCKPLELLHSENAGEKPPKANWLLAVAGVLILGAAYAIAVTIKSPLAALLWFFVAVIMVIVATYLLFISGSVTLCKLLQKNKKYYYKKQHFVSVSSMAYRMKRNGAGLASICILSTMVLVMISSTTSLYFGSGDSIQARYPYDAEFAVDMNTIDHMSDDAVGQVRAAYEKLFSEQSFTPKRVGEYRYASITGILKKDTLDYASWEEAGMTSYEQMCSVYFVNLSDYNRMMHTDECLAPGEAMLYPLHCSYDQPTLKIGDVRLNIVKKPDGFPDISEVKALAMPMLLVVIPDYATLKPLDGQRDAVSGEPYLTCEYYYGYDAATEEESVRMYELQTALIKSIPIISTETGYQYSSGCLALEKDDFYATFGGLFFLGIMLSVTFVFAASMIIYYKQVSEGYEDRARFTIMKNVGMTKQDIKKSINSQVLTVFFAPLLMAGLHLAFAFPLIWKLLQLFNLRNLSFVIWVTAGSFVMFGVFYALVYKATARAYYAIVSAPDAD